MKPIRERLDTWWAWLSDSGLLGRVVGNFDRESRRLIIQSFIVGAAVWGPVFLLRRLIHETWTVVSGWLAGGPLVMVVLSLLLGAAVVAFIVTRRRTLAIAYYDRAGRAHELIDVEGDGLERAIALYYASEPSFQRALLGKEGVEARWELPTVTLARRKFAATLATLGSGGSGGLEASVALMGESLAAALFKPRRSPGIAGRRPEWLRRFDWWTTSDVDHLQTAQLSGIAAAVATLTGAPFMSAFFAAEVMYRRRPLVEKLIYSLISTLVAYFLSALAQSGHQTLFNYETLYLPPDDWRYYGTVLVMSLVIAVLSLAFIKLRRVAEHEFHHRLPNAWLRHFAGAGLTAVVALAAVAITAAEGLDDRAGALNLVLSLGDPTIERAMAGELTLALALIALFGKMLATTATISSGGSGGLLTPSLYIGAMVAAAFGAVTPFEPMTLIVPAMTASLVSIVNVPLAAMLLPVELFSAHYLPPALVAVVVCTLLTEDRRMYRTQREEFDNRQIAPGVAVRRVLVPVNWDRRTLVDLDLRRRFNVTVIGVLEMRSEGGATHVRLDPSATLVLAVGDTAVVLGREEDLDELERHIHGRVREMEAAEQAG